MVLLLEIVINYCARHIKQLPVEIEIVFFQQMILRMQQVAECVELVKREVGQKWKLREWKLL